MNLYNDYGSYLKNKYGCKVYRIGLDAGFTCPNRDGTKGAGGCIYCNETGSRASYAKSDIPLKEQLAIRIAFLKSRVGAKKFIAYFQAFTNTYAPAEKLKRLYDEILPFEEIVGLAIGTRPDAIDEGKLRLISSYNDRYDVWIEYGLQSIHDRTLAYLKRGHDFNDFLKALGMTKGFNLNVSAHVILGLPDETLEDMIQTAKCLSDLKINGIKIHPLHILRHSALEKVYNEKGMRVLGQDEYVECVCGFLEHLSPEIIIQRLTGQGTRQDHLAPAWALDKHGTINKIREALRKRGSRQGVKIY